MTRFVNAPNIQNFVNSAVNRVRYFLGFDAVLNSYAELETAFTPAGDFKAKIDFSTTSSAAQTLFGGELAGTDEIKLEVNTSGYVVASAYVGTSLQTAITSSVALDNGKLNSAEIVYTGTTAELFVNNVTIGTQTWALDGNQTIKYVGKLSTGTYFQGVPANPVLTDVTTPANSQAYRLDRATENYELPINNVTGSEEVTNGDFSNGTTGWAGITVTDGAAIVSGGAGTQTITTVIGNVYTASGSIDRLGVNPRIEVRDGIGSGGTILNQVTATGAGSNPYSFTFTATSTSTTIVLENASNTALYKNISVKQVTNALVYNNIPKADREQFKLVGATEWLNISPAPQQLPATLQVP